MGFSRKEMKFVYKVYADDVFEGRNLINLSKKFLDYADQRDIRCASRAHTKIFDDLLDKTSKRCACMLEKLLRDDKRCILWRTVYYDEKKLKKLIVSLKKMKNIKMDRDILLEIFKSHNIQIHIHNNPYTDQWSRFVKTIVLRLVGKNTDKCRLLLKFMITHSDYEEYHLLEEMRKVLKREEPYKKWKLRELEDLVLLCDYAYDESANPSGSSSSTSTSSTYTSISESIVCSESA